jgi:hypothetical protein
MVVHLQLGRQDGGERGPVASGEGAAELEHDGADAGERRGLAGTVARVQLGGGGDEIVGVEADRGDAGAAPVDLDDEQEIGLARPYRPVRDREAAARMPGGRRASRSPAT